jgi:hypothetical protein
VQDSDRLFWRISFRATADQDDRRRSINRSMLLIRLEAFRWFFRASKTKPKLQFESALSTRFLLISQGRKRTIRSHFPERRPQVTRIWLINQARTHGRSCAAVFTYAVEMILVILPFN